MSGSTLGESLLQGLQLADQARPGCRRKAACRTARELGGGDIFAEELLVAVVKGIHVWVLVRE